MHRIDNKQDDQLIDLGSVVEETKGDAPGQFDGQIGQRQLMGLSED